MITEFVADRTSDPPRRGRLGPSAYDWGMTEMLLVAGVGQCSIPPERVEVWPGHMLSKIPFQASASLRIAVKPFIVSSSVTSLRRRIASSRRARNTGTLPGKS